MRQSLVLGTGIVLAHTAVAGPTTYDFDDLVHGEIVGGAYAPGLSISGENFNRSFDIIAGFDTRRTGTRDSDLEGPNWAGATSRSATPTWGASSSSRRTAPAPGAAC